MATDAQGRELSDDGYYYWDGSDWQPVDQSSGSGDEGSTGTDADTYTDSSQPQNVDAQGRQLSDDGNYYWDGSDWQLVENASVGGDQDDDDWFDGAAFEADSGAEHEAYVDLPEDCYSDIDAEAVS